MLMNTRTSAQCAASRASGIRPLGIPSLPKAAAGTHPARPNVAVRVATVEPSTKEAAQRLAITFDRNQEVRVGDHEAELVKQQVGKWLGCGMLACSRRGRPRARCPA